jgi:hypothetical protein
MVGLRNFLNFFVHARSSGGADMVLFAMSVLPRIGHFSQYPRPSHSEYGFLIR